jgi:hypothetical protein
VRQFRRVLIVAGLVSVNLLLARGLFAQGSGCDGTCVGHNPGCAWIATGAGGWAQGCIAVSTPYWCGGEACGTRPADE